MEGAQKGERREKNEGQKERRSRDIVIMNDRMNEGTRTKEQKE